MIRILAYILWFCIATAVFSIGVCAAIAGVMLIVMFITWTVPTSVVITWGVVRLVLAVSMLTAAAFMLSKEAKEFIDSFVSSYDRARN